MSQYLTFALAFAVSALSPGPEIAAVVSRSLSGSLRTTLPLALGLIIGKLLMLSAAVLGLSAMITVLSPAMTVLKYLGVAYLLWLGLKKWRSAGQILDTSISEQSPGVPQVWLGLTLTLSNPIAIMFYLALLPGIVNTVELSSDVYVRLCLIVVGVMLLVVSSYALLGQAARRVFTREGAKRRLDRSAAVLLMGAGILMAFKH